MRAAAGQSHSHFVSIDWCPVAAHQSENASVTAMSTKAAVATPRVRPGRQPVIAIANRQPANSRRSANG